MDNRSEMMIDSRCLQFGYHNIFIFPQPAPGRSWKIFVARTRGITKNLSAPTLGNITEIELGKSDVPEFAREGGGARPI